VRRPWLLAGAALILVTTTGGRGAVAATEPTDAPPVVQVTPSLAAPGQDVLVQLEGFPSRPANVSVCGNLARRGSEDCDLIGSKGVDVTEGKSTFRLRIAAPPVHCPCVIRAVSSDGSFARQAPFDVLGHPAGPPILPASTTIAAAQVPITARVEDAESGLIGRMLPYVAGPANKQLVMTIRNDSAETIEDISVTGAVGRKRSEAEPLDGDGRHPVSHRGAGLGHVRGVRKRLRPRGPGPLQHDRGERSVGPPDRDSGGPADTGLADPPARRRRRRAVATGFTSCWG
jgi:hypothetical protein